MDLQPGEEVIYQGHPSWRATMGFYVAGLLLVVLAGAIAAGASQAAEDEVKPAWVALAALAALVVVVIAGYLKRRATHYLITTQRLRIRRGILSRHVEETRVNRIQDTSTYQTFFERILRIGTVDFDTAGEGDERLRFVGVSDPAGVVRAVGEASHRADGGV